MLRLLLLLCCAAALAGCDSGSGEAQRQFDAQAFGSTPSGITARGPAGEPGTTDPDDWRVGPYFTARAQVTVIPFPNPAGGGETVTLQLFADGTGPLSLVRLLPDGRIQDIRAEPVGGPTFVTFTFFASEISVSGTGLHRVWVLDSFDRVVTYGDIQVTAG
jgi:hypothetical protein